MKEKRIVFRSSCPKDLQENQLQGKKYVTGIILSKKIKNSGNLIRIFLIVS